MGTLDEQRSVAGDTTLRRGLTGNLVVLVLVVAGVVGTILLIGSYRAVETISEKTIEQASKQMEARLDGLFDPVERKVRVLQDWGEAGELEINVDELAAFNERVRPLLDRHEQLSAVAIADTHGLQYVYWEDGDSWVGRFIASEDDDEALIRRWNDRGEMIDEWTEELDEEDRRRPWYEGAMATEPGESYWTEPFEFFTDEQPGMALARRFEDPIDGRGRVVGLGVSLSDVSRYTTGMRPTEQGQLMVTTATGEALGLPVHDRYEQNDELLAQHSLMPIEELDLPMFERVWESWRERGQENEILEVDVAGSGDVRAGFRWYPLGDRHLVVTTVIPRDDLTGFVDRQRNVAIGVGLVGVGLAVVLSMWISARYRRRMARVYDDARELGQYRLGEKLGVGGMGEVYRAEHGMLERPTAVKLLKPDMYDEDSVERFAREVKLSCQLTHPNTVTIFDYGETEEGLFYYAMELLEGATLDEFLDYTGPLEEGRVVYLMRQICGALLEAHSLGLIHRDVKPSNIMVGDEGGLADRITVLDFGLVKDVETPDDTQLTNQDYLHGSPGFMAPEVILGEAADDPAVDIFALGVVCYTLLCGREPFEGESAVEVLMAQVDEEPKSPSEVLDRRVDPKLEELIMGCLAKKPGDRYSSIEEVIEALVACEAADDWTLADAIAWWDEHGDDVVPTIESPETYRGEEAHQMTINQQKDVTTTLDDEPPGLGQADTAPDDEQHETA